MSFQRAETRLTPAHVYWKVTVWDKAGKADTSTSASFEIGLLKRSEWKAKWIGAALRGGSHTTIPVPYVRKAFNLPGKVKSARLYVTALQLYKISMNGQRVGDDVFAPGWTDYAERVQYGVYDVAALLHQGENALGALLGDGWAVGQIGLTASQQYMDRPYLLAQLEVTLSDDQVVRVVTDHTWKRRFGALLESDIAPGRSLRRPSGNAQFGISPASTIQR